MPIFEYRCGACGERYEALMARGESGIPGCPRCGTAQAERLISTFAVGRSQPSPRPSGPCGSAGCPCRGD